jgi:hypothetical protein
MKTIVTTILFLLLLNTGFAQTIPHDSLYLGQTPPADTAIIFAPGIISLTNRMVSCVVFSPDGKECYFDAYGRMYCTKYENNKWSKQVMAPFLADSMGCSLYISADGNKFYFEVWKNRSCDLWMAERTLDGWNKPKRLPSPINSDSLDYSYSQTLNGVGYFTSNRPGGIGNSMDIWRLKNDSDKLLKVENLGSIVNSNTYDFTSCIAPDESYIIFSSFRYSSFSDQDLWISFNKGNNQWTKPISMESTGAKINVKSFSQLNPKLSSDGKYLFFSREDNTNNKCEVYWVSTHIIEGLRKVAYAFD